MTESSLNHLFLGRSACLVGGVLLFASLGTHVPGDIAGEWTGILLFVASLLAVPLAYRVTSVSPIAGYVFTLLAGNLIAATIAVGLFHGNTLIVSISQALLLGGGIAFLLNAALWWKIPQHQAKNEILHLIVGVALIFALIDRPSHPHFFGSAAASLAVALCYFAFGYCSSVSTALQEFQGDKATWKDAVSGVLNVLFITPANNFARYVADAPG
jgi:hypothetical protein